MLRKDVLKSSFSGVSTSDPQELERFNRLAAEWRKPDGKFRVVHAFNGARMDLLNRALRRLATGKEGAPLAGLNFVDVGCAAGLIAEHLAISGARVVGIDASEMSIAIARRHARDSKLEIDYRCALPEQLVEQGTVFNAVVRLEVIEHVDDVPLLLNSLAALVRPGGKLIVGTINRTPLSWLLATVAAGYILRWLPRGTYEWVRFVRPDEIVSALHCNEFFEVERHGITFNPLRWQWQSGGPTSINYMLIFDRVH